LEEENEDEDEDEETPWKAMAESELQKKQR
jgi:hypothetical protein